MVKKKKKSIKDLSKSECSKIAEDTLSLVLGDKREDIQKSFESINFIQDEVGKLVKILLKRAKTSPIT